MEPCKHTTLTLVQADTKQRCRECHLVLSKEELGDSYCPECFEASDRRNYDFEEVDDGSEGKARYFCEDCGAEVG